MQHILPYLFYLLLAAGATFVVARVPLAFVTKLVFPTMILALLELAIIVFCLTSLSVDAAKVLISDKTQYFGALFLPLLLNIAFLRHTSGKRGFAAGVRLSMPLAIASIFYALLFFASVYRAYGVIDTSDQAETHDPLTCIYFSIVTWTTLGYGDFRPTPDDRFSAATEALVGYIVMAIMISGLTAWIINSNREAD
jgi:hypothetical protein